MVELAGEVISAAGGLHGLYDVSVYDSIYKKLAVEFRALLTEGTIKVKLAMP